MSLIKVIKNAPSALLSYISTREFSRTRGVPREARAEGECFCHFSSVLKKCLYKSTMYEEQVFYFFYKMSRRFSELSYVFFCDVGSVHYNSIVHARDVERVPCWRFNELDSTNQSACNSSNIL